MNGYEVVTGVSVSSVNPTRMYNGNPMKEAKASRELGR